MQLLEVACSPDSVLSSVMQEITGNPKAAIRLSLWNQHDLGTNEGVRAVLDKIDLHDPEHVWLAPECGPYSVMQNVNQRTEQQKQELAEKRKQALKTVRRLRSDLPILHTERHTCHMGVVTVLPSMEVTTVAENSQEV